MSRPVEFIISVTPFEAAYTIVNTGTAKDDLIHYEYHVVEGSEKQICVLVFDRFYFRTNSNAALTVILENFDGINKVKCIPAGSGEGIFALDWGAGKNFVKLVEKALKPYILEEHEI